MSEKANKHGAIIFYSDQVIPENERLDRRFLEMVNKDRLKLAYIPSASDGTRRYYREKCEYYKRYGIEDLLYFDLNKEYDSALTDELLACDAIHLSGGDPFQFLGSIRKRKFGPVLKKYLNDGGILLGISAGAIVLTPSINISHVFYKSRTDQHHAVGLVDFHFLPHWNQREDRLEDVKRFSIENKATVYACRDGDGMVVRDGKVELVGDVVRIEKGLIK
ncbi:MAG: Type 1 glutamine amidotransferase-like domain-containing protein [Candidatus Edwardsbacteria bacterium]|nr:Type 1 glutamine amidotransferase-like domain-containing protein [Candidatus Edwardsbacteria bacterium]MBU1576812.1 Type 1 glutamine amidotransferase-like domain-containing protein [Candidatus Edwardsbacteria bacterium]MBU2463903.1 Type 1 glutamine amidotransferase-like domain-containing protein [Candidatus Edwardsbacteria bacterium]MBU2593331.1 Type 1 glutamine amidotransferase-like domain-containing protein [Candidatus Edwardsbacteria bacterium]